jgi:transposase
MGWFYGFKLHAIINHKGELVSVKVTAGNTDDRVPVKDMATSVFGKVFGDRGYISKALNEWLTKHSDTTLITKLRRNMKPQLLEPMDEALLNHRSLVETVFGELKNLCQIEHSRHRSVTGFITNLLSGLIAYCWFPYKPTIKNMPQQGQVATL